MLERYYRGLLNICTRLAHGEAAAAGAGQDASVRMLAVIRSLPRRRREAFVLHRFEGLSHAQIALRMNTSRRMVREHVRMAMLACRQSQWAQPRPGAGHQSPMRRG